MSRSLPKRPTPSAPVKAGHGEKLVHTIKQMLGRPKSNSPPVGDVYPQVNARWTILRANAQSHVQQPPDARSGIGAVNRVFEAAFARGDFAEVASLYSADGMLLPPRSNMVAGKGAIAQYWREAMKRGTRKLETTELEVYGDVAHEVGRYAVQSFDGAQAEAGLYTVLWRRDAGVWKMHRDIWNNR